jgi:hypothetical protein
MRDAELQRSSSPIPTVRATSGWLGLIREPILQRESALSSLKFKEKKAGGNILAGPEGFGPSGR